MAKESGRKVILKVGNGATPTELFTALAGQRDTQLNLSADSIDTSDKTTGNWGTTLAGTLAGSVTCSGVANWPDTAGLKKLQEQFLDNENINCELITNADGDKWKGTFSITQFNITGNMNEATSYDITLNAADALTFVEAP